MTDKTIDTRYQIRLDGDMFINDLTQKERIHYSQACDRDFPGQIITVESYDYSLDHSDRVYTLEPDPATKPLFMVCVNSTTHFVQCTNNEIVNWSKTFDHEKHDFTMSRVNTLSLEEVEALFIID